jgi:hypothetical protein
LSTAVRRLSTTTPPVHRPTLPGSRNSFSSAISPSGHLLVLRVGRLFLQPKHYTITRRCVWSSSPTRNKHMPRPPAGSPATTRRADPQLAEKPIFVVPPQGIGIGLQLNAWRHPNRGAVHRIIVASIFEFVTNPTADLEVPSWRYGLRSLDRTGCGCLGEEVARSSVHARHDRHTGEYGRRPKLGGFSHL